MGTSGRSLAQILTHHLCAIRSLTALLALLLAACCVIDVGSAPLMPKNPMVFGMLADNSFQSYSLAAEDPVVGEFEFPNPLGDGMGLETLDKFDAEVDAFMKWGAKTPMDDGA